MQKAKIKKDDESAPGKSSVNSHQSANCSTYVLTFLLMGWPRMVMANE
ncbi:MAG TPA: hypothetical protein VLB50_09560 [Ignavibacteriaceae bacterium]|nr:hypothetical protein [Ignavibacteriaceae bacterium]